MKIGLGKTHKVEEASASSQLVSKSMFFSGSTHGDFTLSNSRSCREQKHMNFKHDRGISAEVSDGRLVSQCQFLEEWDDGVEATALTKIGFPSIKNIKSRCIFDQMILDLC
jgi:hypothetical protein